MEETIREWNGTVIGKIETNYNGDKTVRSWGGKILGYYDKSSNYTKDFSGRILYQGDMASALLILYK